MNIFGIITALTGIRWHELAGIALLFFTLGVMLSYFTIEGGRSAPSETLGLITSHGE